jgi:DNA-binding NarL/FixJ family response regulator
MALAIKIIAFHPLAAKSLVGFIRSDRRLSKLLSMPPVEGLGQLPARRSPYLFVLDSFWLPLDLAALVRTLRVRYPQSKFLVLVPPIHGSEEDMLRMLHKGIDGVAVLSGSLQEVLPEAVQAILEGNYWAPEIVLAQYRFQTHLLLDQQLLPELSLTGRESQVFQLMVRRLSNKEIADAIGIGERTVRFHVSNIFAKLRAEDRRTLLTALETLKPELA